MKLRPQLIVSIAKTAYVILVFAISAQAQQMIGSKSGVIQSVTGEVFLDGTPIQLAKDNYLQVENGQVLSTRKGYAELVLAPAAYLWLGEYSVLKMRQNKLIDIQFEITQGSAVTYILETIKTNAIHAQVSKSLIEIKKKGLYRIDSIPGEIRVYAGDALVNDGTGKTRIKKSHLLHLNAKSTPERFNLNVADALHRRAIQRAAEIVIWMYRSPFEISMK
jgi:hypothetical protein